MLLVSFSVLQSIAPQTAETPVPVGDGLIYLILACVVVWLFIFGYLYSLNRRQNRLQREIELLKQEVSDQPEASQPHSSSSVLG